MNHWERFHKIFIASVYVAIIAGGAMIIYPKYGEMTLRKNECDKVCELLAQKEQAIRALKDKQYRMMHDPVYVEKVLHENRSIRDNEIILYNRRAK